MSLKMKNLVSYLFLITAGAVLSCTSGCGGYSNVGQVTGVITVEGEPLEGANIAFYPTDGRASQGVSDASGRYELNYIRKQKGAVIGEHIVTISTRVEAEIDYRGDTVAQDGEQSTPTITAGKAETLPKKYVDRRTSDLRATVTSGSNSFDFDLEKKKKK